jgi:hypothetical protein
MVSQLDPVDRQGVKIDPAEIHLCCELNVAKVARLCAKELRRGGVGAVAGVSSF